MASESDEVDTGTSRGIYVLTWLAPRMTAQGSVHMTIWSHYATYHSRPMGKGANPELCRASLHNLNGILVDYGHGTPRI
ncbi:MAG: hypothetical protein ACOCRN_04360 [Spirochaetia bacterium]